MDDLNDEVNSDTGVRPIGTEGPKLVAVDVDAIADPETGKRVRLLREKGQFTQVALAKAAGVSQSEVSRAEKSPGSVKLSTLMKIAEALGSNLYELSGQRPIVLRASDLEHLTPKEIAELSSTENVQLVG